LRGRTEALAGELHALMTAGVTPDAEYEAKCNRCSLIEICMPKLPGGAGRVDRFVTKSVAAAMGERLP
jgi:CRISPR-associated exonuclease Cas4